MKNKKELIIMFIGTMLIVIGCIFASNSKTNLNDNIGKDTSLDDVKKQEEERVNNIKNLAIDPGVTKEKLEELIGHSINYNDIMVGKDSYLRLTPAKEVIAEKNLDDYVKKQSIYAERVEARIIENFDAKVSNYVESVQSDGVITIDYRVYYYALYISDLNKISSTLMDYASVDTSEDNYDELEYYQYISKVKAMEILDDYLDNYENKDEYRQFSVVYDNQKISEATGDYYYSCLINYQGAFYDNISVSDEASLKKFEDEQDKRVNEYLNNAIEKGNLNKSKPFELK